MTTTIERNEVSTERGQMRLIPFDQAVHDALQDPDGAVVYMQDALEESVEELLHAMRKLLKANGGMKQAAAKTGFAREALYSMLSEHGNPAFRSLQTILEAYGFEFTVRRKERAETPAIG